MINKPSNKNDIEAWEAFIHNNRGMESFKGVLAGTPRNVEADAKYLSDIEANRASVKKLAIEDPMIRSASDYRTRLAVSDQIRLKPNLMWKRLGFKVNENRKIRKDIKELWTLLMESDEHWPDSQGMQTISQLASQNTRIFNDEGESMTAVYSLPENRRSPLSFTVANIDPARVRDPADINDLRSDGLDIRKGILKSRRGFPLGYYVHDYVKGANYLRKGTTVDKRDRYDFIPRINPESRREEFIHNYVQVTSDLSRGISNLVPLLKVTKQKQDYVDAALEDAISKAGLTFVLKSNESNLQDLFNVLDGDEQDPLLKYMEVSKVYHENLNLSHKGNRIARLLHGEDLHGFSSDQAGGATFEAFCDFIDIVAASTQGMSLEEYTQRWDKTNYSGARSGKLYLWQMIQQLRADSTWRFVRKIYALFLEDIILQGYLKLPGFDSSFDAWRYFRDNKAAFCRVEFFGAPRDEIDDAKKAQRYLMEQKLGVFTAEAYCNEMLHVDWEDRLDQIIEEAQTLHEKLSKISDGNLDWTVNDLVLHKINFKDSSVINENINSRETKT